MRYLCVLAEAYSSYGDELLKCLLPRTGRRALKNFSGHPVGHLDAQEISKSLLTMALSFPTYLIETIRHRLDVRAGNPFFILAEGQP